MAVSVPTALTRRRISPAVAWLRWWMVALALIVAITALMVLFFLNGGCVCGEDVPAAADWSGSIAVVLLAPLYATLTYPVARALARRRHRYVPLELAQHLHGEWLLDDPCPRCDAAYRTQAGWCEACEGKLSATPRSLPELTPRLARAFNARDTDAAAALCAHPYVVHGPDGERASLGRTTAAAISRALVRAFPDAVMEVEATFRDPSDPSIVWSRIALVGHSEDGAVTYSARRVQRHRVGADGRIVEAWAYPALR